MLTFLAHAKNYTLPSKTKPIPIATSEPASMADAVAIAVAAGAMSAAEIAEKMKLNDKLAAQAYTHLHDLPGDSTPSAAAALVYSGMVFKKLDAATWDATTWAYAQDHFLIASFVYGLLRPADAIKPYRMEGDVLLPDPIGATPFEYWKDRLTDAFIARIQAAGGTLCDLASEEMKRLFHWDRVKDAVRIVQPLFFVRKPDGSYKQIVIYTKMARGLMTRHILTNRIEAPEALQTFVPNGYRFDAASSTDSTYHFYLDV